MSSMARSQPSRRACVVAPRGELSVIPRRYGRACAYPSGNRARTRQPPASSVPASRTPTRSTLVWAGLRWTLASPRHGVAGAPVCSRGGCLSEPRAAGAAQTGAARRPARRAAALATHRGARPRSPAGEAIDDAEQRPNRQLDARAHPGPQLLPPHSSIPTSRRRPPVPLQSRIDPRRWSRSCSASASASWMRRPARRRTTIIARTLQPCRSSDAWRMTATIRPVRDHESRGEDLECRRPGHTDGPDSEPMKDAVMIGGGRARLAAAWQLRDLDEIFPGISSHIVESHAQRPQFKSGASPYRTSERSARCSFVDQTGDTQLTALRSKRYVFDLRHHPSPSARLTERGPAAPRLRSSTGSRYADAVAFGSDEACLRGEHRR
jgi:hypothetical protein